MGDTDLKEAIFKNLLKESYFKAFYAQLYMSDVDSRKECVLVRYRCEIQERYCNTASFQMVNKTKLGVNCNVFHDVLSPLTANYVKMY